MAKIKQITDTAGTTHDIAVKWDNVEGKPDVLHSGNYNNYSPSLTGTGASGEWNITASGVTNSALSDKKSLKLALVDGNNIKHIDTLKWDNSSKTLLLYTNNLDTSGSIFAKGTIFFDDEATAEIYHTANDNTLHLSGQFLDLYSDKTTIGGNLDCIGTCTFKDSIGVGGNLECNKIVLDSTNNDYIESVNDKITINSDNFVIITTDLEVTGDLALSSGSIYCYGSINCDEGFNGNLNGTATNATNVNVTTSSTSSNYPLVFTSSVTAGNKRLYTDTANSLYYNPSTNLLKIDSGKVEATNGFYETSDERLKDIIKPLTVDLDKLAKLRKVYFNWKDTEKYNDTQQLGMIAQDVQAIYPELVSEAEDGQLSLAYDKLSVIALEAIDVLHKENDELKSRIERLETLVNQLIEKN